MACADRDMYIADAWQMWAKNAVKPNASGQLEWQQPTDTHEFGQLFFVDPLRVLAKQTGRRQLALLGNHRQVRPQLAPALPCGPFAQV